MPNPLDMIAGPPKAMKGMGGDTAEESDDPHARKLRAVSRFRKAKTDEEAALALEDAINACLEYSEGGEEEAPEEV